MASCGPFARAFHRNFNNLTRLKASIIADTPLKTKNTLGGIVSNRNRNYSMRRSVLVENSLQQNERCSCQHYTTDSSQKSESSPSINPFNLVESDLAKLCNDIKEDLISRVPSLKTASDYHFDGEGKAFRPMIVMLMARAINCHNSLPHTTLMASQRKISQIAEMIHVASLVHDDVIDAADTRRGKASVMHQWGQKKAILTGDFILSAASQALARIGNEDVVKILSQVLEDLVRGEFMQLGSKEDESERFNHYLRKTYKKTASLIANSCRAVAVLGQSDYEVEDIAFEYGKNVGIAFQLVDDLLEFISSEAMMGKPAADLKLGLATGPVLFAAQQYPDLNALIMRRFSEPGDVEIARELVSKSDGVSHTRMLAEKHAHEAIRQIQQLNASEERDALVEVTNKVLHRLK